MAAYDLGVDVSAYQGVIAWDRVAASKIKFAFIKASEGITIVDKYVSDNAKGADSAGIDTGYYHFYTPSDNTDDQVKNFTAIIASLPGALPPVLDVESGQPNQNKILDWLNKVAAFTSKTPIVYGSTSFLSKWLTDPAFASFGLWLADWASRVIVPKPWEKWNYWQFSDVGQISGIHGKVDLNYRAEPSDVL